MTDDDYNRTEHLFYGMPAEVYDAGYRYDLDNAKVITQDDGTIKIQFPLIDPDGNPVTVRCRTGCLFHGGNS